MATAWYYQRMGEVFGPFSAEELRQEAEQGRLTPDDTVRKGDDGEWMNSPRVKGLFHSPHSQSPTTTASTEEGVADRSSTPIAGATDYKGENASAEGSRKSKNGGASQVSCAMDATVRFRRLSDAFSEYSPYLGGWVLIVIVSLVVGFLAQLAVEIGVGIFDAAVGSALASVNASNLLFTAANFASLTLDVVCGAAILGFVEGGQFYVACKQSRGQGVKVRDFFQASRFFVQLTAAMVLIAFVCSGYFVVSSTLVASFASPSYPQLSLVAWLLLVFVPIVIVTARLMFVVPLIVDGEYHAVSAIVTSWKCFRKQTLKVTVFHSLVALVSALGVLIFCVGLLFTLPIYFVAISLVYRDFFPQYGRLTRG